MQLQRRKRTGAFGVGRLDVAGTDADEVAHFDYAQRGAGGARGPQVIICSRTHSQLAQFAGEIARYVRAQNADAKSGSEKYDLKVVTVGSRVQSCVNPAVNAAAAAF